MNRGAFRGVRVAALCEWSPLWRTFGWAFILLAAVLIPRLVAASLAVAPARDAARYWSAADVLSTFPWRYAVVWIDCQPIYPFVLAGIGSLGFREDPHMFWRASQALGIAAYVVFLGFAWLAGARLWGPRVATLGCLFVAFLPRQIRYSVDVLADGLHAAFWMASFALAVLAWPTNACWARVLCLAAGVAAGLAYGVRTEALLLPCVFVVAMTARQWSLADRLIWREWASRLVLFIGPILLAVGLLWGVRGSVASSNTGRALTGQPTRFERGLTDATESPAKAPEPRTPIDAWMPDYSTTGGIAAVGVTLAQLALSGLRVLWEFLQETRGWLGLAFAGVVFVWGKWSAPTGFSLVKWSLVGMAALLVLVRWKAGFLAGRYMTPVLPLIATGGAMAFLSAARHLQERYSLQAGWSWGALSVLAVTLSLSAWMKPLHADRQGEMLAADWLRENTKADEQVFDSGWLSAHFSNRRAVAPSEVATREVRYAVLDEAFLNRPPVAIADLTSRLRDEGEIVAQFPRKSDRSEAAVRIVRIPFKIAAGLGN